MLNRVALLAVALSACTGASTYYPSGQPQYAQSTVTSTSADGTQTQTSTTTYQSTSYEQPAPEPAPAPQPASYQPPPPPAPAYDEDDGPRCDPRDNREMCTALGVIYDVGRLLERLEERSCGKAARALNRYADRHEREIEVLLTLEETQTEPRLRAFIDRHKVEATLVLEQAMDLDARCGGDDRFDRAMRRLGFRGMLRGR